MSVTLSEIAAESLHLSGNPIYVKATTSGIPVGATEYAILLKVVSSDGEIEGGPWVDRIVPDANGESLFDISGRVDHAVEKTFNWPRTGFANPHVNMVYDIWLYPGERYIDSNGDRQESYGDPLQPVFIIKGKLPLIKLEQLNLLETDFAEYYSDGGRYFTFMPSVQTISPYQPVKIWYQFPATGTDKTATFNATFSDGSTQEIVMTFDVYRDVLIEFDAGAEHVGFTMDDGEKKLVKYTFQLTDCELFTFNVDWNYYEKYYYLLVDNQIGGIDCFWLRGRVKYEPSGERTISVKPLPKGSGTKTGTLRVSGFSRQRKWIINSGVKPGTGEMEALETVLDSPNTWLLMPPANGDRGWNNINYEVIPVIVTNASLALRDEMEYKMDSIDLEIIEAH